MTTPDASTPTTGDAPDSRADAPDSRATPGQQFVAALAQAGGSGDLTVAIDAHLPGAFPLFASRPRYPVRHLLNVAPVDPDGPAAYVYEPSAQRREDAGTTYDATPEATFLPELREAELSDLTVSVSLPPTILDRPTLLTAFIDRRVLVRTATMENQVLLRGSEDGKVPGLLALPGMRRRERGRRLDEAVTAGAFEVEEAGGCCGGRVGHPAG